MPSFNCDATPYAAAKLAVRSNRSSFVSDTATSPFDMNVVLSNAQGESTLKTLTTTTPGFSGIALRIGWCQPGANMPDTMSATGTPTIADDAADANTGYSDVALGFDDEAKILPWFENMWFSNRDMLQCIERCVDYEEDEFKVIFGMSANSNMRWGTFNSRQIFGVGRYMYINSLMQLRTDISNDIGYEPVDDVVKVLFHGIVARSGAMTVLGCPQAKAELGIGPSKL
eukprot:COSAG01_NODE_5045_length_4528_cov_2.181079_5_plen_228_part_00